MAGGYAALLSLLLTALTLTSYQYSSRDKPVSSAGLSKNMTVYAMAVGQGDGNIIVCPNDRDILIVDMGSKGSRYAKSNYGAYLLKEKFKVVEKNKRIHVVITHTDEDHYNFLKDSLLEDADILERVQEIVIGNKFEKYGKRFHSWIKDTDNLPHVYTINNGSECFGNRQCAWTLAYPSPARLLPSVSEIREDPWQFCGDDVDVTVLGANVCIPSEKEAGKCTGGDANTKSVILRLAYDDWSLFLSGDFEGVKQQGRLRARWSHMPSMLRSTYYKVSHHGAWTDLQANSKELLQEILPRRAYISHGHPITTFCIKYIHPRCEVLDNLINLHTIDMLGPDAKNSLICWQESGTSENIGNLERRNGYAIYETCREYDVVNNRQICHDIVITTDGRNDHTSYVSVPEEYQHVGKQSSNVKESCKTGREEMKEQLLKMPILSATF